MGTENMRKADPESLKEEVLRLGAKSVAVTGVNNISFDTAFRSMCASNACGNYGKSYMCPPDIGEIDDLIREAKTYSQAVVYQTVGLLEDSYDFEGMMEAGRFHNDLAQNVRELFEKNGGSLPVSGQGDVLPGGLRHQCIQAGEAVRDALYQRGKYRDLFRGGAVLKSAEERLKR